MKNVRAFMRRCKDAAAARAARGEYDDVKVKGPSIGFDELVPERDARAERKAKAMAALTELMERNGCPNCGKGCRELGHLT